MKFHRKLGALAVLGVTAGVSMLAGSVLLGTASADEPSATGSTSSATKALSIAYRATAPDGSIDNLAPSCTISYRVWTHEDGELPNLPTLAGAAGVAAPTFAVKAIESGDIEEAIASGEIKLLQAGEAGNFTVTAGEGKDYVAGKRIEIKPGEAPQVFEFKGEPGDTPEWLTAAQRAEMSGPLGTGFQHLEPSQCTVISADGMVTPPATP